MQSWEMKARNMVMLSNPETVSTGNDTVTKAPSNLVGATVVQSLSRLFETS